MLSIEAFVITNFMMNLLLLGVSVRGAGHAGWRRVTAAASVGTIYAVAAYVWPRILGGVAAHAGCLCLMALILFGTGRRWLRGCRRVAGSAVFAGGVMVLLERWLPFGGALITAVGWLIIAILAFFGGETERSAEIANSYLLLRISTGRGSADVESLVDTGNRLREPVSGLPVLIVGRDCLKGILDEACLNAVGKRLPPGFRMVSYGVMGGSGEICCFKPESVCALQKSGWSEMPDVWVAVYPGSLPSGLDAIAPPSFAQP